MAKKVKIKNNSGEYMIGERVVVLDYGVGTVIGKEEVPVYMVDKPIGSGTYLYDVRFDSGTRGFDEFAQSDHIGLIDDWEIK